MSAAMQTDLSGPPAIVLDKVNKWYGAMHVLARRDTDRSGKRTSCRLRSVRLRQVHHDPLHQPPGDTPGGPYLRRRHRTDRRSASPGHHPPRGRHGLPVLQPVPPPDDPGKLHFSPDLGPQDAQSRGGSTRHGLPGTRQNPRAGQRNTPASSPAASSSASPSRARSA